MDTIKIGRYIAKKRKEKGITQKQLGDKLGVTNKTVSRWENGNYMPDLSLLEPLSKELDISLNELLAGEEIKTEQISTEKILKQTEQSLANTLHYSNQQIKKSKYRYHGLIIGTLILVSLLILLINYISFREVPHYSGDVSEWSELFPNHSAYGLEISYSGKPVFRNTTAALGRINLDNKEAIKAIKKEFHILLPLSKYTYKTYVKYAKQFVSEDETIQKQTKQLIQVLDIYKNSFEWKNEDLQQSYYKYTEEKVIDIGEKRRQATIVTLILGAFSLLYILLAGCDIYKYKKRKQLKCETKGVVTGLVKSHLFRNDVYGEVPGGALIGWGVAQGEQFWGGQLKLRIPPWFPCVKYTVNEKEIYRIMGDGNVEGAWRQGEEVTILYNEDNPWKSEIREDNSLLIRIKLDFAIAFIFFLTAMISIIFMSL